MGGWLTQKSIARRVARQPGREQLPQRKKGAWGKAPDAQGYRYVVTRPVSRACCYRGEGSVTSLPSRGAPVPDDPMKNFRPSSKVTSRPLALAVRSLLW